MVDKQLRFDTSSNEKDFEVTYDATFPSTRYQGSKQSIINWLWEQINSYNFDSLLDVFGGTGVVAFQAKKYQKKALYNDYLPYNYHIGKAIIENNRTILTENDIDFIINGPEVDGYDFIQEKFEGIYFTDDENKWLDNVRGRVVELENDYKQSLAIAVIGQSCLAKRPYNLFHRANLDLRMREDVDRSFGNKTTWDKSFEQHFKEKVTEFNRAVFDNERENNSFNRDLFDWDSIPVTDAVYIDPPYYDREKNNISADYQFYYHFLNGYIQYDDWSEMINNESQTKEIEPNKSGISWDNKSELMEGLHYLFNTFDDRIIFFSYNSVGFPTPDKIKNILEKYKTNVDIYSKEYQYALSPEKKQELLFVGYDK